MSGHVLRRACAGLVLVFATIGSLSATPAAAFPPLGTFQGVECLHLPEAGGDAHVEFTGTFTGVPFIGFGTYYYEVTGPLNGTNFPGTWSMVRNPIGSISGTHVQTSTLVKYAPAFEAQYIDKLTVTGGTNVWAGVQGHIVAFGTRRFAAEPQEGCFLTFDVSGLLLSGLQSRGAPR